MIKTKGLQHLNITSTMLTVDHSVTSVTTLLTWLDHYTDNCSTLTDWLAGVLCSIINRPPSSPHHQPAGEQRINLSQVVARCKVVVRWWCGGGSVGQTLESSSVG